MKLNQINDGWYAVVEPVYESKIREGRVARLSDLLVSNFSGRDTTDDGP